MKKITLKTAYLSWNLFFAAVVALALSAPLVAAAPPAKVSWSTPKIELEVPRGGVTEFEVQFSVTTDTGPVTIEPVPSLADIVSMEPSQFDSLEAGQSYSTRVVVAPQDDAREGIHNGTIHLRSGSATRPATLKVSIVVEGEAEHGYVSDGTVMLEGAAESDFNAISSTLSFSLAGATYSSDSTEIQLYHQGLPVPADALALTSNSISVESILDQGRNELLLIANDVEGRLIYEEYVLWAGSRTLQGNVLDMDGQPVNDASVTIKLGDDAQVTANTISVDGQFSFSNLPPRTVILEGVADSLSGSVAANGGQGYVTLSLLGFYAPSDIDNNDFSQGLSGWELGNAPVSLEPHAPETQSQAMVMSQLIAPAVTEKPTDKQNRQAMHDILSHDSINSAAASMVAMDAMAQIQQDDMDLVLATSGEGPQTISRAFNTTPGVRNVRVRYRFITTEVPGGYFGTQYNDYFSVNIRSALGGNVSESNSMNGMGLGAFDGSGRTAWREQTLTVDPSGETVQVDITVANVADGILDSYVVVDLIEEQSLAITNLQLNDIDSSALQFLSASPHTYFSGNTRIHGAVTVEGAPDDALTSLELEVIQGGGVVATAALDAGAQGALIQTFGDDNTVEISNSQLLFNLVPTGINTAANGTVSLRVRAQSQNGDAVTLDAGAVEILRQPQGLARFGPRDVAEGGDDWAKPSVADFIEQYAGLTWGDFSNMNGGPFAPHASHRTGNDADGWFSGYNARDAATAATIVGHLNQPAGSRITAVFVSYEAQAGNAFYDAIQGVTLNDGRLATDVIRPVVGHSTHFHWRVAN